MIVVIVWTSLQFDGVDSGHKVGSVALVVERHEPISKEVGYKESETRSMQRSCYLITILTDWVERAINGELLVVDTDAVPLCIWRVPQRLISCN